MKEIVIDFIHNSCLLLFLMQYVKVRKSGRLISVISYFKLNMSFLSSRVLKSDEEKSLLLKLVE